MYFVILFGSREVKICKSEAFDCFNPNWQVTCILFFFNSFDLCSTHGIAPDYFFIYQTGHPLDPAQKNICLRFQAARCSHHLVGEHFVMRLRSSKTIYQSFTFYLLVNLIDKEIQRDIEPLQSQIKQNEIL